MSYFGETDAWSSDRNEIDTFEEYSQGAPVEGVTQNNPTYYFQGNPYYSLVDFDQAKRNAAGPAEAPGIGYGNIGGFEEIRNGGASEPAATGNGNGMLLIAGAALLLLR